MSQIQSLYESVAHALLQSECLITKPCFPLVKCRNLVGKMPPPKTPATQLESGPTARRVLLAYLAHIMRVIARSIANYCAFELRK